MNTLERRLAEWYARRQADGFLKRVGFESEERGIIMGAIQQLLTLNYAALKGWRTALGVIGYIVPDLSDKVAGTALCTQHIAACAVLKALAVWFTAMGIRGA